MAEMSSAIVCPVLFKQIVRAGRRGLRERLGKGESVGWERQKEKECALRK